MTKNSYDKPTTGTLHPMNDNELEPLTALPPHSYSSDVHSCKSRVQSEEECSSLDLALKPLAAALGRQAAREWIRAHSLANDNRAELANGQTNGNSNCTDIDTNSSSEDIS